MTNDQYCVTGGFWSLYAVRTPGAPLLSITSAGNEAIVSWPPSVTGWTLQTNNNLGTTNWGNYLGASVNNAVTNSSPTGNLFFRHQTVGAVPVAARLASRASLCSRPHRQIGTRAAP